jgi:hypothetical protein
MLLLAAFALAPTIAAAQAPPTAQSNSVSCNGILPVQALRKGGGSGASQQQPNLVISSACVVNRAGTYYYGNVNIINGGTLTFSEPLGNGTLVNFWAANIIVENGGALVAGANARPMAAAAACSPSTSMARIRAGRTPSRSIPTPILARARSA